MDRKAIEAQPVQTTREIEDRTPALAGRTVSEHKLKVIMIMLRGACMIVARDKDTRPVVRRALLIPIRWTETEYGLARAPIDGPCE